MPLYEYKCRICGKTAQQTRKVNDPPIAKCDDCNTISLERVYSSIPLHFKGFGFYETDYKNK